MFPLAASGGWECQTWWLAFAGMEAGSGAEWAAERLPWPLVAGMADPGLPMEQLVSRAALSGFAGWWSKVAGAGFCARPIHLVGVDGAGREYTVLARCKNRRASVCPSCSDLYAADTWQLVTAGVVGGRHGMPESVAWHPAVFVTLTAPSFGLVHGVRAGESGGARRCHLPTRLASGPSYRRCVHGKPLWCSTIHDHQDNTGDVVGQPLCVDCYDYLGHVLFTWVGASWSGAPPAVKSPRTSERWRLRKQNQRRHQHLPIAGVSPPPIATAQAVQNGSGCGSRSTMPIFSITPLSSWSRMWQCITLSPVNVRCRMRTVTGRSFSTMTVSRQIGCAKGSPFSLIT